ncbi:MAG: hypothetical protein HKN12_11790 [Gemmatimonadetes bacterium]|nr:hypothetical protein [Gemmatimonadota bacterium]
MKPVNHVAAGTFLVASPMLQDPNFVRTVVLMCEYGPEGSWGLVLNRRTALTYGELLDELPFPAAGGGPVFWGGPCETSRMQVLHSLREGACEEPELIPGVRMGLTPEQFRNAAADPRLPGESLHAYVGHAGWGASQLDLEIDAGSWILCSGDPDIVFETEPENAWEQVLLSLGPEYPRLMDYPADPRLN